MTQKNDERTVKEILNFLVKYSNRDNDLHWIHKTHFSLEGNKVIVFLYYLDFDGMDSVGLLLPTFTFKSFDFICYPREEPKEIAKVTFLKRMLLDKSSFKSLYDFHVLWFQCLEVTKN